MITTARLATAAAALIAATAPAARAQVAPPAPAPAPASAPEGGQAVLLFTPDFFADQRPNTALDMVGRVPGFSVNDGDGSRGFEGAVGNVLINGARPASKNDTGSSVLGRTLARQVERIELIRGGAPGIDMQGYSLVVNVILKSESSRQSVVTVDAKIFDGGHDLFGGSYQFTAREGERTWGVTLSDGVSMSDSNGEGVASRRDASGTVTRLEDFYNDAYGGGRSVRGNFATPVGGGRIDLTARYGVNDFQSIDLLTSPTSRRDSRYDSTSESGEVGAVYTRSLRPSVNLETRFIHTFSRFDTEATFNALLAGSAEPEQRFTATGDDSETIVRGLIRYERSPRLTFEGGGEVAYNMLQTEQDFAIGGSRIPLPSASVKVEETRGEVFGRSTWRVTPRLQLEGGLRLETSTISQSGDADQEKTFFFAKPRLQATWTSRPNNQFRFRLEREVGQLNFGDFAASADLDEENVLGGNVDLEPESRWISEAAYERRFWGDGIVSLTWRHDQISNAIDVIPLDGGLSAVGNIGEGTLDRLSANIVVPTDRLGIPGGRLSFRNDWNRTEVTDPTTGESRPISGVRPLQPNFSFSQDIPSWKLNWSIAYLRRLIQDNFDPDQTSSLRGSDYFEAAVEYKPTASLSLRAQINVWNDFDVIRTVYADRTATRPIAYVDTRAIDPRTFVSLRLRKTF